jgi:very-short-patch-repair endonuclease
MHPSPIKTQRARELRQQMTPAERTLWRHLRGHQLDGLHFRRQEVIRGFIVDFYCDRARLVVEVDGPIHHQQAGADQERDAILAAADLRVLRVTNDQVEHDIAGVLARIHDLCSAPPDP